MLFVNWHVAKYLSIAFFQVAFQSLQLLLKHKARVAPKFLALPPSLDKLTKPLRFQPHVFKSERCHALTKPPPQLSKIGEWLDIGLGSKSWDT